MSTGFIVCSIAGLYKSGLHGWVWEIDDAYRFPSARSAGRYIQRHARCQWRKLFVLEETEKAGEISRVEIAWLDFV